MYEFKYLVDTFLDDILAIGSILLCGLIVCGLIGIKYYLDNRTQQKRLWLKKYGEHTDGTVISMYEETIDGPGSDIPHTIKCAGYWYYDDGKQYTGEFVQDKKNFYHLGDIIAVYYNKNNPSENCTDRHIEEAAKINCAYKIIISIIAAVTLGFAIWFAFSLAGRN